jgi:bifunctional non-homologous end joining protein LigD
MSLTRYRQKRNFQKTAEPRGRQTGSKRPGRRKRGWSYCIQKHAASHLHYDFRLEIDGVLKSWAVPKGPSLDPAVKHLAMHVEDHPLEYGSFEGTIPLGEYGGGTVMLWDHGTWSMDEDPAAAYRQGKLHFTLHGDKLRGEWVLVRRSGGRAGDRGKEPWFLFKIRDEEAREGDADGVLEREPDSALSGRTMEEIAAGKGGSRQWKSGRSRPRKDSARGPKAVEAARPDPKARKSALADLKSVKKTAMPRKVKPQLATLVKAAPAGDDWLNEIKFDGYRMVCHIEGRKVTFSSRNGLDWTARVPHLVQAARGLGVGSAILDGEVVALTTDGSSSFQDLQNAFSENRAGQLVYYVFDLLYLDGRNLMKVPLNERKQLLETVVTNSQGPIRDAGYIVGQGPEFYDEICKRKLEGIICKRRDRPYVPGRSTDWLKVKCAHREEFVVGGFTRPSGSRIGFGALLLGYYDREHELRFAGRVGTGFNDKTLHDLHQQLAKLEQPESPFADLKGRTGQARGVRWVQPRLVAQVSFSEWTREGHLRHPAYLGLREDKAAKDVHRERPVPLKKVPRSQSPQSSSANSSRSVEGDGMLSLPKNVRMTHPDKLLWPEDGITKAELAGYYASIADWILPHLVDRPLTLVRCPGGIRGQCFYQKHAEKGMPEALGRIVIAEKRQKIEYAVVKNVEGLLSLVHMNTLEIHIWGSRVDNIERPDRLVFDLDPDEGLTWKRVIESARQIRELFKGLGFETFLKTTGGKGLHVVVPIDRRTDWDDAKQFCADVADAIAIADPDRYTTNMSKAARSGKIFLDYLRNGRGATSVAAYSTRARDGCPVSTPISWDELPHIRSAAQFTLANVPARLQSLKRDPWEGIAEVRQSITKSLWRKLAAT